MFKYVRNLLLIFTLTTSSAYAVGEKFDQPTFDRLLNDGKPVLVDIHADWCSTCRAQEVILKDLLKQPPYNKLNVLQVDFDKQRNIVHAFHARWQSTLIIFANGKEIDRSTADTDKQSIAQMLHEAL